ncbi:hypothetical protein SDC9_96332 [bioreactor metagenome]|uniref:Uncharacterized protein n=1 Tax=bioreactor metagenome TaxID=1076179 RepID=A0A645A8Z1_9ZZZZ
MVEHVEDRAGDAGGGHREDPHHHEAEVAHRGERHEPHQVALSDRGECAVDDRDQRQHQDERGRPHAGLREQAQAEPQHAEGADLVQHRHHQGGAAGVRGLGGVGQPGVHRHHRRLDGERDEETGEQPLADRRVEQSGSRGRLQRLQRVRGLAEAGGDRVDPDHRDQHHQAAGEREEQELHRSRVALVPAESADQEVHRDQGGLEEEVEEQHVGGHEHVQRQALQQERQAEERLRGPPALVGVRVVPDGDQHDGHQDRGQQDHQQAHAVDAQRVRGADGRDPGLLLDVLHAVAGLEADGDHDRDDQRHEGEGEADRTGQRALDEDQRERADQGQHRENGEPGKRRHVVSPPVRPAGPGSARRR